MADTAFGIVEKLIKLGLKIQEQAKTAHQNEQECQSLEQDVGILMGILSLLQRNSEVISHPAINATLLGLEKSLDSALSLVTDCQGGNALRRFFMAGHMSRQLRHVQNDIKWKMGMGTFATNVLQLELTVTLTNTIHYQGAHPPPLTQPQDARVAAISYGGHLTTGDARSGVNNEITMVEAGSEVTYAPSSRLTTLNSSKVEATMHHFSEENISAEGGHYVLRQKIVLKVSISCDRCRNKTLALASKWNGVKSLAITGAGKDVLVVIGAGVDAIRLVCYLRKKVGQAELIQVEVKQQQKPVEPSEEGQEPMGDGKPGGVVSAAARQHGRSYSSSEVTGQNKLKDAKVVGARKSKKGWLMACRTLWCQLQRGNKSAAAKKALRRFTTTSQ